MVLTGALGLGLAACSRQDAEEPAPPASSSGAPASSPAPTSPQPSTGDTSAPSNSSTASRTTELRIGEPQDLVTGLTTPWGLRSLDDDSLLVSERDTGAIKIVRGGRASQIGAVEGFRAQGEGGVLGIDLSPDTKVLYVYLSTGSDNRVLRYDFDGKRISSPKVILDGIPAAGFHNGGQVTVGPDEYLYISTGDASQREQAQDTKSLAGKILRIAPDGSVPEDNPFTNPVWSYGHRNVQGLAFDDGKRLWSVEFGDKSADEVNLIVRAGNFGWPEAEGNTGQRDGFQAPKVTWEPTASSSPSGCAVAAGQLWVGALMGKCLFQVPLTGEQAGDPVSHFADRYGRIRAVAAHAKGLVFSTSNTDGRTEPREGDDRLVYLPLS